jgi:nitrite reductase/ring-hydroxylating ferredoxin subunit
VLLRLQTADHIRLASPVQKEQGTRTTWDRTRIMRFPMGEKAYAVALVCAHRGCRIFSDVLRLSGSSAELRR